jgi:UDP-3-O-[3-hydroxymyristoyl] glucosamine N-acyltransferase
VFAAQTGIAGSTIIGNYNRVGGQCGFAGHIKVGDNNEFGAQSGIPNNVGNSNRLIGYPAIDARSFAKNLVYIKKLESLFKNNKK